MKWCESQVGIDYVFAWARIPGWWKWRFHPAKKPVIVMNNKQTVVSSWKCVSPRRRLGQRNRKPPETISFVSLTQLPDSKILSSVSWRVVPKLSTVLVQLIFALLSRLLQPTKYLLVSFIPKKYCLRGEMENRFKEQQLELFSDRTSTHTFEGNQFWVVVFICLRTDECTAENSVYDYRELRPPKLALFGPNCSNLVREYWLCVRRVLVSISGCPYQDVFCNCLQLPGGSPHSRLINTSFLAMLFDNCC